MHGFDNEMFSFPLSHFQNHHLVSFWMREGIPLGLKMDFQKSCPCPHSITLTMKSTLSKVSWVPGSCLGQGGGQMTGTPQGGPRHRELVGNTAACLFHFEFQLERC